MSPAPDTPPARPLPLREIYRQQRRWLAWGAAAVFVTQALRMVPPWLIRDSVDQLARDGEAAVSTVVWFAIAIIVIAVVGNVVRIASRVLIFDAARGAERDIRFRVYRHLQTLGRQDVREHPTGEIISRTTNDLTNVRALLGPVYLNAVNTVCTYLLVLPILISVDPWLALLALLPNPFLIVVMLSFARSIMSQSRTVQRRLGHLSRTMEEDLGGIAVVRLFGAAPWRTEVLRGLSRRYRASHLRLARTRVAIAPIAGILGGVGMLIVLWWGGRRVVSGEVSLGDFFAFSLYLGMMVWPTLALGWVLSGFQRGRASLDRLRELLLLRSSTPDEGDRALPAPRGELVLEGVTVRRGGVPVLDAVDLSIAPGEVVAVVGRTGAGKTTLVQALARLLPVSEGIVRIDGAPVDELARSDLRRALAVVPQETYLFSATVRENIAFGTPHGDLSDDELAEALHVAALVDDIARLPDGVDTRVGERGVALSGGQRQRVAIARAFVRRPAALLLDDCLSSLDVDTERDILERLPRALRGRTVLVVSHRLSAVQWAERIVVIDRGQIVEEGRHDQLLRHRGVYSALFEEQARQERAARSLAAQRGAEEGGP